MGIQSINEPGSGRTWMVMPMSINEPLQPMPNPPSISSLTPSSCNCGDPDFTLVVSGTGFYPGSTIVFSGNDEPTTLNGDGTLSTIVKPSLWINPDTVDVQVRNATVVSNTVEFTFNAPSAERSIEPVHAHHEAGADPDELEDEIEQAEEEGDVKTVHRGTSRQTLPHKRKK